MGIKDRLQTAIARIAGSPAGESSGDSPSTQQPDPTGLTSAQNIGLLEAKLGYIFRDRSLLSNALLHRSHIHVTGQEREQSNERLEFLGDAVLGLVANEHLYKEFPERSEGDLTKMKSLLVCGARLSEVATEFDLGIHVRMSRSEAATVDGKGPPSWPTQPRLSSGLYILMGACRRLVMWCTGWFSRAASRCWPGDPCATSRAGFRNWSSPVSRARPVTASWR